MTYTHLKFLSLLIFVAFVGCAEKDTGKIADAQACLDKATSTTAETCLTHVDGVTGKDAAMIRCSVSYIKNGFNDPTKLSQVFEQFSSNQGGGGSSQMLNALGFLAFPSSAEADTAKTRCDETGNDFIIQLTGMAQMSTIIASAGNLLGNFDPANPPSATEIEQSLTNLQADDLTALGQVAISTQSSCNENSDNNEGMCDALAAAIGNDTDPDSVGLKLKDYLDQNP